jgi:hypothetical protein
MTAGIEKNGWNVREMELAMSWVIVIKYEGFKRLENCVKNLIWKKFKLKILQKVKQFFSFETKSLKLLRNHPKYHLHPTRTVSRHLKVSKAETHFQNWNEFLLRWKINLFLKEREKIKKLFSGRLLLNTRRSQWKKFCIKMTFCCNFKFMILI